MNGLNRIMKEIKNHNMTFQSSKVDYNCNKCKDTTWILEGSVYKRCTCYKHDLNKRNWQQFGINPNRVKKINDYLVVNKITQTAKNVAMNYVNNYNTIKQKEENGIAFLGQPGAGKSHLAIAIGSAILNKELATSVVYMAYNEAMRELKANVLVEEHYNRLINKYIKSDLLIIDDLFKDKVKKGKLVGELKESDIKHIYPIINQRYITNKPTLYSSECTPGMLLELDEALAGRVLEKSEVIIFKYTCRNNYRMKKFMEE